jgi:hypothetical protein
MEQIREIGDLRPAPRVTPVAVLWAMFAIGLGGMALLARIPPSSEAIATASDGQPQERATLAPRVGLSKTDTDTEFPKTQPTGTR